MLPVTNTIVWNQETNSWDVLHSNMNYTNNGAGIAAIDAKEEFELGSISNLNSFLGGVEDNSWILNTGTDGVAGVSNSINNGVTGVNTMPDMGELSFSTNFNEGVDQNLILRSMDSSSPSPASVFSNIDTLSQVQNNYFLPPLPQKTSPIPALNPLPSSQFNFNSFNLGYESNLFQNCNGLGPTAFGRTGGFSDLITQTQMGIPNLRQFSTANFLQRTQNSGNPLFLNNRSQLLQPLDNNLASIGPQPTLFQKRAAQRLNLAGNVANFGALGAQTGQNSMQEVVQLSGMNNNNNSINGDHFEDSEIDGTNLDYDSDELTETTNQPNINEENANKEVVNGEENNGNKKRKKGPPAKNLMAERRRREKLNDRLKMLRSVVPKISKMDRASILGDAIEYLKELRQKINDIQTELESTPPPPAQPVASSSTTFYPSTPTASALADRVKDKLSPTPNFSASKTANIEVRTREGRGVNIHMFCGRRPGLLLSTMRALDNLGLDIQQAVISCFNGFALDIFKAEQMKEGQDIPAEQIRAMLLDSAGFQGMV